MNFPYYFLENLDLTKFKKHGAFYIGKMREMTYNFFLKNYKLTAEISAVDGYTTHAVTIYFSEIKRDENGTIIKDSIIVPLIDTRFREISFIKEMFPKDNYKAYFESGSTVETVEKISSLVKLMFKINNLKAFL